MPTPTQHLSLADASALIAGRGFGGVATTSADHHIGVELESFLTPVTAPDQLPAVALSAGSRLTFEPGGQVELSSPPGTDVASACDPLSTDLAALWAAFSPLGLELAQAGMSPGPCRRVVDSPRYRAMEAYFDTSWPAAGRSMMCATAAVQVNLWLGTGAEAAQRWRAANVLGPVLAAAFSASAFDGLANARLATWLRLDPSRTAPVDLDADPERAWADYALDANVMLIRTADGCQALVDEPISARQWVESGHRLGWPTVGDVAYHLTTLFPPVRPRGWLELRMIDSLPDPWWRVPVAAAAVLVGDPDAVLACQPAAGRWWPAAEVGLGDPIISAAAVACAERAVAGLDLVGTDSGTAMLVEQWATAVIKGGDLPWM